MAKQRRHELIAHFLSTKDTLNQEELVRLLAEAGEIVTQATVSRDLSALGAVKGASGYQLGGDQTSPQDEIDPNLTTLLKAHAFTINLAHTLVIIKTAPGHAQLLAVGFDRKMPQGIVGCIAGDDTIFLATKNPRAAKSIAHLLTAQLKGNA